MRIAVVSPFVDHRHGTERALAELLERLSRDHLCEIYLYSQRVEGLSLADPTATSSSPAGVIFWRRVPAVPGPHLLQFLSWLVLNSLCRWRDRHFRRLHFDLVFSPGINCFDADFILVHAVFHRLAELQKITSSSNGALRNLHRRSYYAVLRRLERRIYSDPRVTLAAVSHRTASQLHAIAGRSDVTIIPNGVDATAFNPSARLVRRTTARARWNFADPDFVLLLIGNDWRTKGLPTLIEAVASCADSPFRILVVGEEDPSAWRPLLQRHRLSDRVSFSFPSEAVLDFYAASDAYVAPSHEDSFNLPALEAMACGLPVVLSSSTGMSQWIRHGENGMLLQNPSDPGELSFILRTLSQDPALSAMLASTALGTARGLTWDAHAETIWQLAKRVRSRSKT